MLRLMIIPAALLALLAGAIVWSNSGQGQRADFTFVNKGENKTLDIGVMSWLEDMRLAYALWEGLYTPDPHSLQPVPGSADRMTVNDEKTVYTFHIRDEARWSNGYDLTTGDFIFAWKRMLQQPHQYTYLYYYIKGAREYEEAYTDWKKAIDAGKKPPPPDFSMVGVEALSKKDLRVTLVHPLPFFLSLCAFPSFFPQHERSMRDFAQWDNTHTYIAGYNEGFTRPPHLVTNGPYQMTEWSFKRRIRLTASKYYWNRANVQSHIIDQLSASDEPLAQFRIYEAGNADWIPEVDNDMAADLIAAGRADHKSFPEFGTYFYDFNCDPKFTNGVPNPLSDARVRRALVMAIDKVPIVKTATRTGEKIATTLIPLGSFDDYPSPAGLQFNVSAAQKLLAEAGYPGGARFPHLTILFNSDYTIHRDIAEIVRRQWEQNLGVEFSLEAVELKVFGQRLQNHEFAVGRASWFGDYYDPSTFTDVFRSDSDNNDSDWRRPDYDALLKKAEFEKDTKQRMKILSQAENMLLNDAPIMPVYQYVGHYLVHDNVHGIPLDPRQMVMMDVIKVDRR